MTNLDDILREMGKTKWYKTYALRTKQGHFCPITWAAFKILGESLPIHQWPEAAKAIKLPSRLARKIAYAADLDEDYDKKIRSKLLKAAKIKI